MGADGTEELILPIKGMYFQPEGRRLRRRMIPGTALDFMPVPGLLEVSPSGGLDTDPYAVQVLVGNGGKTPVGYVPRTHSKIIRKLLEDAQVKKVSIHKVGTNRQGHWRVSMSIVYKRRTDEESRIERILGEMQVPSREYARLIVEVTEPDSQSEREWVEVYNETCFD